MKICFLMLSHWSGNLGGAELQVRYIMEYLRTHTQHELSMICRYAQMDQEEGTPIYKTESLPVLGKYFKAADYFSVMRLLERIGPDVVYTRVSSPFVGFAARYCRANGKKLVHHLAHIEDVQPFRPPFGKFLPKRLERPFYEFGLRQADVVIGQAAYQDDLLRRHYGRACTAIIPNFHPVPAAPSKPETPLRVMWIANLKHDKQPEVFVRLARQLADLPGVEWVMVGAVQESVYEAIHQETQDLAHFKYVGKKKVEEVNELLEGAHLFVNTSQRGGEGFPNTFIQAWLRCVPVVSLEVNPDGLLDGEKTGICSGHFDRLAEDARALLSDVGRLAQMGKTARQIAVARYSTQNCQQILELMEQ